MKLLSKSICCLFLIALALPASAWAAPSGREIAQMVYDRPDGKDRKQSITLTLSNQSGSTRVRKIDMRSLDVGKDTKSICSFTAPADVKDTMYLSWSYEDASRDDDRWLYMPASKNVRRISGSSKHDYFMGTDFTYDEMGKRSPDKDKHDLIGEEMLNGRKCWKLKLTPKDKSIYTSKLMWVDQESLLVLRQEFYDKDGLLKVMSVLEQRKIDGFWTSTHSVMDNISRKHKTDMTVTSIKYDTGVSESIFNVSTLQRGRL